MKIEFLLTGKSEEGYLIEGIKKYESRLKHYCSYSRKEIPELKQTSALSETQIKEREGELILKAINRNDLVILLDEKGERLSSIEFSQKLSNLMLRGSKKVVFVTGGAYGFAQKVYERANYKLSFSAMTFSHQMIRLLFTEQLYRAFTIIKGEPYHHGN